MGNPTFQFKCFTVRQDICAMKVNTDGVILGASIHPEEVCSILDIGTGTGILALMLAQRTSAHIDAIDKEFSACLQALDNVAKSPWSDHIRIIHTSLQEFMTQGTRYDLIITNPPYFSNSLKSQDEKRNMARHNDFLSHLDLITGVDHLLSENGRFALILPFKESGEFIMEAFSIGLFCNRKINIRPTPQKKINRVIMEFTYVKQKCVVHELIIRTGDGMYTNEYKNLTKEYYLDF